MIRWLCVVQVKREDFIECMCVARMDRSKINPEAPYSTHFQKKHFIPEEYDLLEPGTAFYVESLDWHHYEARIFPV